MAGLFSFPKHAPRTGNFNSEASHFQLRWLFVYTMQCIERDDDVVVKLLRVQIRESKRLFLKEPRILHNINKNSL